MPRRPDAPKAPQCPSNTALAVMAVIAFIATSLSLAELLHSGGYIRTSLARVTLAPSQPWLERVRKAIAAAPLDGLTQDELTAHRQIARIAADLAAGEIDPVEANDAIGNWLHMDAGNALTRWLAAWTAARATLVSGGDDAAARAAAVAVLAGDLPATRASTYERQEIRRSVGTLEQLLGNRALAVFISPKQPEPDLSGALPPLVNFAVRYGAEGPPLNTEALIDVLGRALRDDPMPATALLLANMIERLATSRAQPPPAASAPTDRWAALASDADRFRADLNDAMAKANIDPLDRRPLSAGAHAPFSEVLGAVVRVGTGLMVVLLCMARAAVAAIYSPRSPRSPGGKPAVPPTEVTPVAWRPLWVIALIVILPTLIAAGSLDMYFAGRGPTYMPWPAVAVSAAVLATLALAHSACHSLLSHPRRWHLPSLVLGIVLALYPLLPPVCTSHAERFAFRLREQGWLWPVAGVVLLGIAVIAVRSLIRRASPAAIPARRWLAAGIVAWFVSMLFAFVLSSAAGNRDRFHKMYVESSTHVAGFLDKDWLVAYFDRLLNAPPWSTPDPSHFRAKP